MKKVLLITYTCLVTLLSAQAQDTPPRDEKALRTHTWSLYLQGGASWASGLKFRSIEPAAGTSIAPELGLGINYNLRPWVRFGLNYEFSKYKREQRLSSFEAVKPGYDGSGTGITENTDNSGGVAYRKLWNMYHNIDLSGELNIMELWPHRRWSWFNLYAGTGVGVMFARGNTYTLSMGNEQWEDPENNTENRDNWTSYTWLTAENSRHFYNSFYVPFTLSAEVDIKPQLTLGLKGQYKALFSSDDFAPNGLEALAVVVRYNLVGAKQGIISNKQRCQDILEKCNELHAEATRVRESEANNLNTLRKALETVDAENQELKQQLEACTAAVAECEESKVAPPIEGLTILFPNDVSRLSADDRERLKAFAGELLTQEKATIHIVAEASAEGRTGRNKALSRRRLNNVLAILAKNGIGADRIRTAEAIGDTHQILGQDGRKVEITVSQ